MQLPPAWDAYVRHINSAASFSAGCLCQTYKQSSVLQRVMPVLDTSTVQLPSARDACIGHINSAASFSTKSDDFVVCVICWTCRLPSKTQPYTHMHLYPHTIVHPKTHPHIRTYTHTHKLTYTHAHTHKHTHTRKHTHTHTHVNTHRPL